MEFSTEFDSVYPENFRREAELDIHQLTTYDPKLLEDLIEILTPFETATQCIQGDEVVTSIRVLKATMNTQVLIEVCVSIETISEKKAQVLNTLSKQIL